MPGRSRFSPGNGPLYLLCRRPGGSRGRLDGCGEGKVHWPQRGSQTSQLVTYWNAFRTLYNLTMVCVLVVLTEYVTVLQ
jgi:hypothetical protein